MATHNLLGGGTLAISFNGIFALLRDGNTALAVNPRLVMIGVDDPTLWVEFVTGISGGRKTWTFASHAAALTAGQDLLRQCASAMRLGNPAGGAIT